MAPPVATESSYTPSVTDLKSQLNGNGSKTETNGAKPKADILEDWSGNYQFAPIEEAEVSRAMIKRCVRLLYTPVLQPTRSEGTSISCTSVLYRTSSLSARALLDSLARIISAR